MTVPGFLPRYAALACLGIVVFGLCSLSAHYFQGPAGVTVVWPANAVVLAFMLRLTSTSIDRRLTLVVAYVAMASLNISIGRPWEIALLFPLANVMEIALAAWVMRGVQMPLTGLRDLGRFMVGAVIAAPLASTLAAGAIMAGALGLTGEVLVGQAGYWFLADLMGMAIVAPFALSLGSVKRSHWGRVLSVPVVIGVVSFLLCWQIRAPVLFIAFPLVAMAVVNDRDRGGALGVGAVTLAIALASLLDQGPIARLPAFGQDPVTMMAVFLCSLVLTAYPLSAVLKRLDLLAALLDERRELAETASAAKSELIGRVGQELRSPLTGVVTVAEILRSGHLGGLNERQRDLLARVAESGAEIESLSREMIALAEGGLNLADRSAAFVEVVSNAVAAAYFKARKSGVEVELLPGDPAWVAQIDSHRLYRLVMSNLLTAIEAAGGGGRVRLLGGLESDGMLRLTIEDSDIDGYVTRAARFGAALQLDNGLDRVAQDHADLVRIGGDLRFGVGSLGGGRLLILLPRAGSVPERRIA